ADALVRLGGKKDHPLTVARATITEQSPLLKYEGSEDPYTLAFPRSVLEYGALKVLCEQEAERQFPGRTLVLRSCYIFGPGMSAPSGAFYWPARVTKGGEVLVAGDATTPLQFIDVRDLAECAIKMIEGHATGCYNTVGPSTSVTLGELLNALR